MTDNAPVSVLLKRDAYWTYTDEHGPLYYFAPANRAEPPYLKQIHSMAIIDVAADGTLAGVELIEVNLPPAPMSGTPALLSDLASVKAENERLRSTVKALRSILQDIGGQLLAVDMDEDQREHADFHSGYEWCVRTVRQALAASADMEG